MTNDSEKPRRFLDLTEVRHRVGLAKSTIYARVQAGTFPKPVPLGASSRWVEAEIDQWMANRIDDRDQAA